MKTIAITLIIAACLCGCSRETIQRWQSMLDRADEQIATLRSSLDASNAGLAEARKQLRDAQEAQEESGNEETAAQLQAAEERLEIAEQANDAVAGQLTSMQRVAEEAAAQLQAAEDGQAWWQSALGIVGAVGGLATGGGVLAATRAGGTIRKIKAGIDGFMQEDDTGNDALKRNLQVACDERDRRKIGL